MHAIKRIFSDTNMIIKPERRNRQLNNSSTKYIPHVVFDNVKKNLMKQRILFLEVMRNDLRKGQPHTLKRN